MMRSLFWAAAALLIVAGAAAAAGTIYRNNVQLADHVQVPGTRIMIVPPKGSTPASRFRGFEDLGRGIGVEVRESERIPSSPQQALLDASKELGVELGEITAVVLNGAQAAIAAGGAGDEARAAIFSLPGRDASALLIGRWRADDPNAERMIRESMLSAIWAQAPKSSPQSDPYTISAEGTSLKLERERNFTMIFKADDAPARFTSQVVNGSVEADAREAYAVKEASRAINGAEHTIVSSRATTSSGLPAVEIIADFQGAVRRARTAAGSVVRRHAVGRLYLLAIFDDDADRTFLLCGVAENDADNFLEQFRRIASTFQLKR